jgi:putative flippase GtrA
MSTAETGTPARAGSGLARFVVTGGIAALVNLGSRIVFSLALPYVAAVPLAYVVGMVVAFLLARRFVFTPGQDGPWREFGRFAAVNVVALLQVWAVSVGLAEWLFPRIGFAWHAETVAHLIGVASPVVTSYFMHKHFTFRQGTPG